MIIDFHTHVFPPLVRENRERYVQRDRCFADLYSSPKARLASAEDLIAAMDRDGIDVSVVLNAGWATHELCVELNDYILDAAARYPGRLIGFCTVRPEHPGAAAEMERCVRGGARGVGEMRPDLPGPGDSGPEALVAVMDVIRRHGLVLLAHASEPVGHSYRGKGRATPGLLYSLIEAYPDVTWVCAHWGGGLPFYALMPDVREALANVYFDSAATPFLYRPQVYADVVGLVGADRVLFGSDFPLLSQRRLLEEMESAGLVPEVARQVLSGNARRLLGIPAPAGQ